GGIRRGDHARARVPGDPGRDRQVLAGSSGGKERASWWGWPARIGGGVTPGRIPEGGRGGDAPDGPTPPPGGRQGGCLRRCRVRGACGERAKSVSVMAAATLVGPVAAD